MPASVKKNRNLIIATIAVMIFSGLSYGVYRVWRHNNYNSILAKTAEKRLHNFERREFVYQLERGKRTINGYLLITPYVKFNLRYGKIVIMDSLGNLLYKKDYNGAVVDFRQWNINGHTRYTYGIDDSDVHHITLSAGHIVVMDSALNTINEIQLMPHGEITRKNKEGLDLHDFVLLSDSSYIAFATYQKTADNIPPSLYPAKNNKIATTIIQEVKNGKVIWQWDASKYPEFYMNSTQNHRFYDTNYVQDYIHCNSMVIDQKDNNLLLSLRQLNQVIKINRTTGEIMWRLGGKNSDFPLNAEQVFLRQHSAVFSPDGHSIILFDNGDKPIRPFSRVLEFKLDEKRKLIDSFKSYIIPEPFTESLGSVQKIDSDYLICGGTANYILLINSITGVKKLELKANQSSYRAYWVKHINGIIR